MNVAQKFEIDSHIPAPCPRHPASHPGSGGRPATFPFADLEIGQSFFVPGKTSAEMLNVAGQFRRRNWGRFVARKWVDDGVQGARVWRIE